jgi:hypothetical protein
MFIYNLNETKKRKTKFKDFAIWWEYINIFYPKNKSGNFKDFLDGN